MNVNFTLLDQKQISQVLFPYKNVDCNIFYNNSTYKIKTKASINFDHQRFFYTRFRIDGYENSDIMIKYKLIIKPSRQTTIQKANPKKILIIQSIEDFDKITNKYGKVNDKEIIMNWKKLSKDFAGIDIYSKLKISVSKFKKNRYQYAYFNGKKYQSWLPKLITTGGVIWKPSIINDIKYYSTGIKKKKKMKPVKLKY